MGKNTTKYHLDHTNRGMKSKNQVNINFIDEKLAITVIMDCRTTSAHVSKTRLEFKKYDVIVTKEQSVLSKISSFEAENIQT